MIKSAKNGDDELIELEKEVVKLNGEIDAYITRIRASSERYRSCTS